MKSLFSRLAATGLVATVALGSRPTAAAAVRPPLPPGVRVERDRAYVPQGHPRQKLDLYLPPGPGPFPVVIWIHGGAWTTGDKAGGPALNLLAEGYAVASINYRLSQDAPFPAAVQDCRTAVRWLRKQATLYRLDPRRFAVWGSSAGGHLAAMVGVTGNNERFDTDLWAEESSAVQAVVDFFGPTDFLQMDAHRLPHGMVHESADSPESAFIGGPIRQYPERVRQANPITYVDPKDPPFLVVHGDRDPLVPHHQSVLLVEALRAAGVPVRFHTVKGGGHGGFRDPKVPRMVRAFFRKHLGPASAKTEGEGESRRPNATRAPRNSAE